MTPATATPATAIEQEAPAQEEPVIEPRLSWRVDGAAGTDQLASAERIAASVVGPAAADVDRDARFPKEAIEAMRAERLLSVLVPQRLGGAGSTFSQVAAIVEVLGRQCASTAMIYAMHQIQVACLVRHGSAEIDDFLRDEVVGRQALLASATTEAGIGGDVRTSSCAVEAGAEGDGFVLRKNAPVISYGQYADAILVTARRCPESPPSDQVLVLCRRRQLNLEPTSGWDTLGFRGTCSPGFLIEASGPLSAILPQPYADISARTMLPVSHLLWSHVWLGIAGAAVSVAHSHVRNEARKKPGTLPPAAIALAELVAQHLELAALTRDAAARYESASADTEVMGALPFAIAMNLLKVSASTKVVDIVTRAMRICGMAAYREDSSETLGRLLRDAHGAALMVNNDRILNNSAQMLLVSKEGLS